MKNYSLTFFGACLCFVSQALVINLFPFFFSTFNKLYDISLTSLAFLTTVIFGVQFLVDIFGYRLADKLGYKKCVFLCNVFIVLGLVSICFLIELIPAYIAIIVSILLTSIGGGLIETITSPMVEAIPFNNKETKMSLLHSFFCWGHLLVILLNTLMISFIPLRLWKICFLVWTIIPILCSIVFIKAPVTELKADEKSGNIKNLFSNKIFLLLLVAILCAGAIEQTIAQWTSYFTETSLGISKRMGDLIGVCGFALCMATARTFYGLYGHKLNIVKTLIICGILAGLSLVIVAFKIKALSVALIALSGITIGVMWPLILSLPTKYDINGGTKAFSMLALFGDSGCLIGPLLSGLLSSKFGFSVGLGISGIYGFILAFVIILIVANKKITKTP